MITLGTRAKLQCDLNRYHRATDDRERLWHFDTMVEMVYLGEPDLSINEASEAVRQLIRDTA